ncbi:MAG: endonuclease/exonuclease/phosphatase family protein [Planctomycetota bacterium]
MWVALLLATLGPGAEAQWNPAAGQWGRSVPTDLRVMTWNVQDVLCSTQPKQEGFNGWAAQARIVAALQPDVLLVQEAGDNSGNGTGSGVDNVGALMHTLQLFVRGGFDPFQAESVGSFVQLYAPDYDLPYIAVSASTDGFNRNALLSRYPLADLNGDGQSAWSDMPTLTPHLYASAGGSGGLRGWQLAEIDLPDALYAGDLVVGNSHLKSGSTANDHSERVAAAQNMAYCLEHLFNGAGLSKPDPFDKLADFPPAASVLPQGTFVLTGGDWNEDESKNGAIKGPAEWIAQAQISDAAGGLDGTDRDRSDMLLDAGKDPLNGSGVTHGTSKLDYIAWGDSVGLLRRAFLFNSASLPASGAATPPELQGFPISPQLASGLASDHRPVLADFELPASACRDALVIGPGTPGNAGQVPLSGVCGSLARGESATFSLSGARPLSLAFPVLGSQLRSLPLAGGVLLPAPPLVLPPLLTDSWGALSVSQVTSDELAQAVPAATIYVQWVVLDRSAAYGKALSNALAVSLWP